MRLLNPNTITFCFPITQNCLAKRSVVCGVAALWSPGGRCDEPRHVAFQAAPIQGGSGVPGVGPAPVDLLSPAPRLRAPRGRASQARPEDLVHRRGADRPDPPEADSVAVCGRRAPQSLGAPPYPGDSHLQAPGPPPDTA